MALIQITAYVRDYEDLAKWRAISNKTEWLHLCLNNHIASSGNVLSLANLKDIVDDSTVSAEYGSLEPSPHKEPIEATKAQKISSKNWCKEHNEEKSVCRGFKHKGKELK